MKQSVIDGEVMAMVNPSQVVGVAVANEFHSIAVLSLAELCSGRSFPILYILPSEHNNIKCHECNKAEKG